MKNEKKLWRKHVIIHSEYELNDDRFSEKANLTNICIRNSGTSIRVIRAFWKHYFT